MHDPTFFYLYELSHNKQTKNFKNIISRFYKDYNTSIKILNA